MKKIASVITAFAAATALTVSASAYTIDKDLGTLWSYPGSQVGAEEFAGVTPDTLITITYEADKSLADVESHNYWCVKPMTRNEGGDYFIEGLEAYDNLSLSDAKDSYNVDPDKTSFSFKLSEEDLTNIGYNVFIVMGHGVTLKEMTFSNEAAAPAPTETSDATTPANTTTSNPSSGVEGTMGLALTAAVALGAVVVARKKK